MADEAWLTGGDLLDLDGGSPAGGGFTASPLADITASVNLTIKTTAPASLPNGGGSFGSSSLLCSSGSGGDIVFRRLEHAPHHAVVVTVACIWAHRSDLIHARAKDRVKVWVVFSPGFGFGLAYPGDKPFDVPKSRKRSHVHQAHAFWPVGGTGGSRAQID